MKVLELTDIKKTFWKNKQCFSAVDGVSFSIEKGECVGLVGESGCGKSTVARMITRLEKTDSGEIFVNGENVTRCKGKALRDMYRHIHMVFQNPVDSFNLRLKLGSSIGEVLANFGTPRGEIKQKVERLLVQVGLEPAMAMRYPHEVSGGQCQRAAIARAIAIAPELLICDEATSALDVSVQAQIMELLFRLRKETQMSYLFISHDLALVQSICDRVLVMHRGRIVEAGDTREVIEHAAHPYTRLLLASVFPLHPDPQWKIPDVPTAQGEEGDACRFWQRCPSCGELCRTERPSLRKLNERHDVACHFAE